MLRENGTPEHVVDHWHHMVELGAPSLVSHPSHYTAPFTLPECPADVPLTRTSKL